MILLWANVFLAVLSAAMVYCAIHALYAPVILYLCGLTALYFASSCMGLEGLRQQRQMIALLGQLGHMETED